MVELSQTAGPRSLKLAFGPVTKNVTTGRLGQGLIGRLVGSVKVRFLEAGCPLKLEKS